MAKRIIRRPAKTRVKSIKNANLIGAGTPFVPVKNAAGNTDYRASVLKQAGKTPSKPKPNIVAKISFKATGSMRPAVKPTKQVARIKGINRLQQQIAKQSPTKNLSKPIKKKPVIRSPKR